MAQFHPPRGSTIPYEERNPFTRDKGLPVEPPPPEVDPVDPDPWIEAVLPPEDEKRPPPQMPPIMVIQPVEKPPIIVPGPPDITPETIVPPIFEDPIPAPFPDPITGGQPATAPPPSVVTIDAGMGVGTFMVYVGKKLVLTMAAAVGTRLGQGAGAMLVGAVQKQMFRGTTIRFHSGQSFGEYDVPGGAQKTGAVSYEQAFRMLPQEFSYWEK